MIRVPTHILSTMLTLLLWVCLGGATGCSKAVDGPSVLSIVPAEYAPTFDAVLATTDEYGFSAMLRDRRRGIIETEPLISPSAYEPWKTGHYSFEQVMENTMSLQRRRVRWEFAPQQLPSEMPQESDGEDLLGLEVQTIDLSQTTMPIELRVAVFIERAYRPGTRPSIWTTSDTTSAVVIDPETGQPVESSFWTPVSRDMRTERLLLGAVQSRLEADSLVSRSSEQTRLAAQPAPPAE